LSLWLQDCPMAEGLSLQCRTVPKRDLSP